ncbi:hypothetical protein [Caballeronia sp. LZ001]|uniref:hypothetical protein n=1 Tax=Caballeronia sp. LZ001 TaxID=3038553 RepID=UPI002857FB0B|nr:hypothetical protein [Caballeronia sp. LZ001]MDR5802176.1 hypothetical protein [Caballeronia sp. LZ001]
MTDEQLGKLWNVARYQGSWESFVKTAREFAQSDKQEAAQPISDAMMDLVDRLGSEAKNVDPRAWDHMLVYVPKAETKSPDGISYEHLFELANMCGLIGAYSVKEVNDKVVGYARVVLNDSAVQEAFVRANRRALVTSPDKDLK